MERETSLDDRSPSPVRAPAPELSREEPQVRINLVSTDSPADEGCRIPSSCEREITRVNYNTTVGPDGSLKRRREYCERLPDKGTCLECGLVRSRQRIRQHVVQHFMRAYCPCGFQSASRDSVYSHQQARDGANDHGGPEGGKIYVADEESYPAMARHLQWIKVPPFMGCTPVLTPPESPPVGQPSPDRSQERLSPARRAPAKMQRPLKFRLGPIHLFKGYTIPKRRQGVYAYRIDVGVTQDPVSPSST